MRRVLISLGSVAVTMMVVLTWHLIVAWGLVSPVFLPSPANTWNALTTGLAQGDLLSRFLGTVERMLYGWFVASVVGISLGALIGSSNLARRLLGPTLEFLRPLPASAIVPIGIAVLGLSDAMVLAVVGFGALWPMLLATVQGFSSVEPRLYEVARILGMSRWRTAWRISLPSALPGILAGMRISITVALVLSVVGEMMSGRNGLGQWILLSARSFRAADLYAGVILLGFVGYVTATAIVFVEARLLAWRRSR